VYNSRRSQKKNLATRLRKRQPFVKGANPHTVFHGFTGGKEKIMAKTVCKILGVVFILVGVAGFAAPTLLGAHLNPAHNAVHLVSGAIALYFGFAGSPSAARGFCLLFGLVYLLLGICGWFLGTGADRMLDLPSAASPVLMLGKMDHIIHILLGVIFLAGGALGGRNR
jgi:hypothetical protein